jgi:NadR type nicotinamide-nucleotide adenylyltransferase
MINNKIFKVVIIGPESTGKSTLCQKLAAHFSATAVHEYARDYLNQNGTNYSYNDLFIIAQGQINLENEAIKKSKNNLLIVDTDMYVMKVWCEFVFNKCHHFILENLAHNNADLYLLMRPNVPWVKDNLREYPDEETRWKLFYYYKDIAINSGVPFIEINATDYDERLKMAIETVELVVSGKV